MLYKRQRQTFKVDINFGLGEKTYVIILRAIFIVLLYTSISKINKYSSRIKIHVYK